MVDINRILNTRREHEASQKNNFDLDQISMEVEEKDHPACNPELINSLQVAVFGLGKCEILLHSNMIVRLIFDF